MADCIDLEARRDIAKLYTAHETLATTVWGPDMTNGINSKVKKLTETTEDITKRIDELEDWGKNIWHVERQNSCIGKKMVEDLEAKMARDLEIRNKEMIEMKKARIGMYTALGVALISSLAPVLLKLVGG